MWVWRDGKKVWENPPPVQPDSRELAAKYVPQILARLKGGKPAETPEATKEAEFRINVSDTFPGGAWKDQVTLDDPDLD